MRSTLLPLFFASLCAGCQPNVSQPTPSTSPSVQPTATPIVSATPMPSSSAVTPTPSATPASDDAGLNTPFTLNYKQTRGISGENLALTFDALVQDSRCPSDVQCIRAGDVTVTVKAQQGNDNPTSLDLTLGAGDAKAIGKVGPYTVTFQNVQPATKISTQTTPPESYVITLLVQK